MAQGGRLLPNLVPMREQKTMRKDTFSELGNAQRCHRLKINVENGRFFRS